MNKRILLAVIGLILLALVVLALQASAKNRTNPPVIAEPAWNSPQTRTLAARACFDCHSNETRWPLYSALPVVGGLIEDHVVQGRRELNFSEWGVPGREQEGEEAAEKVFEPMHYAENDTYPQPPYTLLHPRGRLSPAEREQLAAGFRAMLGGGGEDEDDN